MHSHVFSRNHCSTYALQQHTVLIDPISNSEASWVQQVLQVYKKAALGFLPHSPSLPSLLLPKETLKKKTKHHPKPTNTQLTASTVQKNPLASVDQVIQIQQNYLSYTYLKVPNSKEASNQAYLGPDFGQAFSSIS